MQARPQNHSEAAISRVEIISAVSVAILREGRFLLVRRARAPLKGQWAFPGGRVDASEAPEQAAMRELLEETGLTARNLRRYSRIMIEGEGKTRYALDTFLAEGVWGEPVAGDDAAELGWYSVAEMADLPITASTLDIARRISGGQT